MEELKDVAGVLFTKDSWPFWSTVLVFTIIGQFTSTKLFTRERAYQERAKDWHRHVWFWARESLMIHPLLSGFTLGLFWRDPQNLGWPLAGTMMYFAAAGVLSLFAWMAFKGFAKKKGVSVRLPGESTIPPAPPQ